MTALDELRAALGDNTLTVDGIVSSPLTRQQKVQALVYMANLRLPITQTTVLGDITVDRVAIEQGRFYAYGHGVIVDSDYQDGSWRVGIHPPPLFVEDVTSTDYVRREAAISGTMNGATEVITAAGHGYQNGDRVIGSVAPAQVFFVVNATTDTFQVSATAGGAPANLPNGAVTVQRITTFRLDPVAAFRDVLADIVKGQQ